MTSLSHTVMKELGKFDNCVLKNMESNGIGKVTKIKFNKVH